MGHDLSHLTPSDAVVTLKSFARRYTELADSVAGTEDIGIRASSSGHDGRSAHDHLSSTAGSLRLFARNLTLLLGSGGDPLDAAIDDPAMRAIEAGPDADLGQGFADVVVATNDLASMVERSPASSWTAVGTLPGGKTIDAMELVRRAVADGSDGLAEVRRHLSA